MRISRAVFFLTFGFSSLPAAVLHAQPASAGSQSAPQTQTAPAPATPVADTASPAVPPAINASSALQPALTQTQASLSALKIDKWKKGSVRDEAGENVKALLRDLQGSIPSLITAADAEPGSLSRAIPLMKHLDAFYDVLLRVEEASRVSAPADQVGTLQQALLDVNKARNAYDDQMQAYAASQEKQVFDLQSQLKAQQETAAHQTQTAAVESAPCKPAAPAHKKRKTTTSSTATGTTTNTAKPSAATPAAKPQ